MDKDTQWRTNKVAYQSKRRQRISAQFQYIYIYIRHLENACLYLQSLEPAQVHEAYQLIYKEPPMLN